MFKLKLSLFSAALLLAVPASAGSMAGINGRAMASSEVGCFTEAGSGGIKNNCTGTGVKNWWIPIVNPRTSTGTVTIKASANGTCTGAPGEVCIAVAPKCTARVSTHDGVIKDFKTTTLSAIRAQQTTVATFSSVATTDILYMYCELAGTTAAGALGLMSVTW